MRRLAALALLCASCVRAPNIILLDRATALELEAAGRFPRLEQELDRAALTARPTPVARERLEEAGQPRPIVEEQDVSDAERIDGLLVAACVGEALDGTLVETRDHCAVKDVPHLGLLLERANRDRAQVWEWLRRQRPGHHAVDVRRAWREVHLRGVPCGAWIQIDGGGWEAKKC
jgi:hypothetical protein